MNLSLPFVSVVVASFNREHIIKETVEAILNQTYPKENFEVVIVDNFSQDNSVNILTKSFTKEIGSGKLKLLALEENTGSAGTYNRALNIIDKRWSFILKMDEDLILDKNCLKSLVDTALKHPKSMMIGGKVYLYNKKSTFHAVGSKLKPYFAIAKGIGVNELDVGQYETERCFDGLNGCMILCARELYESIGWFDEDYFLYYDDHDLMFKSISRGYEHWYSPKAVGYHDTATSSLKKYSNPQWLYYSSRGSWLFWYKNFKPYHKDFFIYFGANFAKLIAGLTLIIIKTPLQKLFPNLKLFCIGNLHGFFMIKKGYYDITKFY